MTLKLRKMQFILFIHIQSLSS